MSRLLALLLFLLFSSANAAAQSEITVQLDIEEDAISVTAERRVKITITAESAKVYVIRSVWLEVPIAFDDGGHITVFPTDTDKETGDIMKELAREPVVMYKTISGQRMPLVSKLSSILKLPRDREVRCVVKYTIEGQSQIMEAPATGTVVIGPVGLAPWFGGLMGAFLTAVFVPLHRWHKRKERDKNIRDLVIDSITTGILGSVAVTILIVLSLNVISFVLPVNIVLNNFYSGVVAGLIAVPPTVSFYKKFESPRP